MIKKSLFLIALVAALFFALQLDVISGLSLGLGPGDDIMQGRLGGGLPLLVEFQELLLHLLHRGRAGPGPLQCLPRLCSCLGVVRGHLFQLPRLLVAPIAAVALFLFTLLGL